MAFTVSKIELEESPFIVRVRNPRRVVQFKQEGPEFYCWIEHYTMEDEFYATFKIFQTHYAPIPCDASHVGSDGQWHLYQLTPWKRSKDQE